MQKEKKEQQCYTDIHSTPLGPLAPPIFCHDYKKKMLINAIWQFLNIFFKSEDSKKGLNGEFIKVYFNKAEEVELA